ncbi:MAG: hypothetical protein J0I29_14990 [Rhizobiales bacterium]|nr:hypothetical protein [Hyphomicrobiales bacterium]
MRLLVIASMLATISIGNSFAADDDIIFAPKNFSDMGDEALGISGTLIGADLGYKNNTYSIFCIKGRKECYVASIEQIGDHQIGRLDYVSFYPIRKWDALEVIASDDISDFSCSRTTITITRKSQSALWVEEPINQTRPLCQKSAGKVRKFTIEDSPGWKRINSKK